jgi:DNA-binding LytR/AlgR family response regulator
VLAAVAEASFDVALLDIQMPGLTGLDASALLPADGPAVIFVTAHPEHALEAFGVGARDYLLKPVDADRLRKALDRVAAPKPAERLALPTARGVHLVARGDVSHLVLDGASVVVHASGKRHFTTTSPTELERRLGGEPFVRVHRRAIVNLDAVELLEPLETGGFVARMASGARVEVSRAAARQLRKRLGLR